VTRVGAQRVVVVGAGLGGLRAAEALRASGYADELVVVGEETHPPYNRPPLSKEALAAGVDREQLEFRRRPSVDDVEWLLGSRIESVDLDGRTAVAAGRELRWDALVLATGVTARRLVLPGPAEGRHVVRTLDDARALRALLGPGRRLVVLGAGFIGCEVAATAVGLGCDVAVAAFDAAPMIRPLGPDVGAELRRRHEAHGVRFHLGTGIAALRGTDRVDGVELADGTVLPADVVVEAVGSSPTVGLVAEQGLDTADGVLVDSALRPLRVDGQPNPVPLDQVDLADLDVFERNEAWGMFDTLRARTGALAGRARQRRPRLLVGHPLRRHRDGRTRTARPSPRPSSSTSRSRPRSSRTCAARSSRATAPGTRRCASCSCATSASRSCAATRTSCAASPARRSTALAQEDIDFVDAIAADFPINVLARLLDVPDEMIPQLIAWGNAIVGFSDPELSDVLVDSEEAQKYKHLPFRSPVSQEIFEYGRKLAAERKGGEGDDLVSKLVNRIPEDGIPLSTRDFDNYFLLLVVAGNETTRQAMTTVDEGAHGQPRPDAVLPRQHGQGPGMVEELIRYASPVYHFRRTATGRRAARQDHQGGRQGRHVVRLRQPRREQVRRPLRLDLTRFPNDHMTFGKGPHTCLGSNLARFEIRILFEELLPRLASIEQTGEIERVRSNFVNGIKRFPVRVKAK
jgi:cytochrome P450/thioredoxin reductase